MLKKFLFVAVVPVLYLLSGCASVDIMQTPLKYGQQISDSSAEFSGYDMPTLSEAILKLNKREGKMGAYEIERISDNSFSVKITDWASISEMGIGSHLKGTLLQSRTWHYDFKASLSQKENNVFLQAEKGKYVLTVKGSPLQPGETYMCDDRTSLLPYMVTTSGDSEQFNRGLSAPFERDLDEDEFKYCFKDFVLLIEKYLPDAK
ncbi:MAG: hypothetical protein PHG72_07295 [Candidatus Omnitrophica bacterium]|jgi:hypothetical protein|nr:hypothetical protein [Candidatus Omnitrophota bacterium]